MTTTTLSTSDFLKFSGKKVAPNLLNKVAIFWRFLIKNFDFKKLLLLWYRFWNFESQYWSRTNALYYSTIALNDRSITLDAWSNSWQRAIFILCNTLLLNGAISISHLAKANKSVYFYTKSCNTSFERHKKPWRILLD